MLRGMTLETLRDRAVADPDDLATRRVYADALIDRGDPRGEAIALGCELEAAGLATIGDLVASSLSGAQLAHRAAQHRRLQQLALTLEPEAIFERVALGFHHDLALACDGRPGVVEDIARRARTRAIRSLRTTGGDTPAGAQQLEALVALPELRQLQRLKLSGYERAPLHVLRDRPRLAALSLAHASRAGIAGLELPALRELQIAEDDPALLDAIARASFARQLRRLELHGDLEDVAVHQVLDGRLPALDHLGLSFATIDQGALQDRYDLHVPRSLDARYVELSAESLTSLAMPTLERIALAAPGPRALAELLRAPALAELELTGGTEAEGALDDSSYRELGRGSASLRRLVLELEHAVPTGHLETIVRRHPLEALHAGGDPSEVIGVLARAARPYVLRELRLWRGELTDEAIELLATAPAFAGLRWLALVDSAVTERELTRLARSQLTNLVALELHGIVRCAAELCELPALVRLEANHIGAPAAIATLRAQLGAAFEGRPHRDFAVITDWMSAYDVGAVLASAGHERLGEYGKWSVTCHIHDPAYPRGAAAIAGDHGGSVASRQLTFLVEDRSEHGLPDALQIARLIAAAYDGVIWDLFDDRLVPISD